MIIVLLCALLLDYLFAEPKKYHPLVGFGHLASQLEERLNDDSSDHNRLHGLIALLILSVPAWWLVDFIIADNLIGMVLEILILYLALGLSSLKQHAEEVINALKNNQLEQARHALSMMVSRDTQTMEVEAISRAATESVLENGNDAVFATIFWFIVAGAPGVVVYRLVNTLDAMWGYKTERYIDFGFFIAKCDDLLNYFPARLTALAYALMGHWQNAIQCWLSQASFWEGSNAGVVMSAGAGALDVQLGGGDIYHGEHKPRPQLGCGKKSDPEVINQACQLLNRSTIIWIILVAPISLFGWFYG
ncbi:MAG: adenosylcobinamide-phosphate synthase CbiB [Gammaproteobacteria bacterium]|nr:adenosylcobinamide-phosphate synthase CbiB [Gammaproteobacteria bacterium]